MKKLIYIIVGFFTLLILGYGLRPTAYDSAFDIDSFSELPVQVGGRIKPIDSVARNTLLILSARQKVVTPEGEKLSPIEWFMDLTMRPEVADTYRVFKIEFPDDLGLAGLAEQGQRYYSFNDLLPHFEELRRLHGEINPEPKKRSPYEQQIADLNDGLMLYHRVMHSLHPVGDAARLDSLVDEYQTYTSLIGPGLAELRKQQAGEDYDAKILNAFIFFGDEYLKLSKTAYLSLVPPPAPVDPLEDWKNIGLELLDVMRGDALSPYVTSYAALTMSYRLDQPETFNTEVAELRQRFIADFPSQIGRVHYERVFNNLQPFYLSMQLYVLVFLIVCASWLRWPKEFGTAAFWVLLLAFVIHTFGLVSRMYIQGRPPVTNLYSSAVFVGWGAVLLGVFIEKFYKNGIGAAMASLVGFSTLIVAHHLAMSGDTLEMMRAVLDSNFWLATHVVVITFGYSAMFLAGALALVFGILGVFTKGFNKETARSLSGMVYGITCFAALFSLVGTILGGIWADQSWGRFWGWDPKENGALMIVVMAAIFLHARWGGICKERGLMALAITGNIITAWSWFGTNLLGVGLHSYGFTDSGFLWMMGFVLSQLVFIGLVLLPYRYWRSEFGREKNLKDRKRILIAAEESEEASVS
ncbi:MAG: cytochrome c biogenesis protein CcsA [Opitutales bacterium]|nr:cytochrome c biogenesis protein CcsA [Opitutales bacterium]MDP4777616.1 cytochrome c biogenesis protein CcsA [Opitutales bacterium]MDP4883123.1 cytochrome c biogenesis protein CcsA [Opitutales bacterium]MDP5079281.1 cytochrome c biogenesis protein CcsA [Opitutales bacterium]